MIKIRCLAKHLLRSSFCTNKQDPPNQIYTYPYNVNRQQNKTYLQSVQRQISSTLTQQANPTPRRKRRIYDRPRFDDNIEHYGAWRLFGEERMTLLGEESIPMSFKIMLKPKEVKHTFGEYHFPYSFGYSSSGQYWFQDNSLSQYVLTEWRNTTTFEPNDPNWDYENQDGIDPRKRKIKRMEPSQFWNSELPAQFRVYGSKYSEFYKFKKWIEQVIENRRGKESYDQEIDRKFGRRGCYNTIQEVGTGVVRPPAVEVITQSMYEQKKQGKKDGKKKGQQTEVPATQPYKLPRKPEQEFRVKETITVLAKEDKDREEEIQRNTGKST